MRRETRKLSRRSELSEPTDYMLKAGPHHPLFDDSRIASHDAPRERVTRMRLAQVVDVRQFDRGGEPAAVCIRRSEPRR